MFCHLNLISNKNKVTKPYLHQNRADRRGPEPYGISASLSQLLHSVGWDKYVCYKYT